MHIFITGGRIAQLAERRFIRKARRNTDTGSIPKWSKEFISQSYLSMQTLLRCPYSPRVQSHVSGFARMLKLPKAGSHGQKRRADWA